MRSNLLSLQNIASQQDIVQNRLATGLKVSSTIDNPSSYYTASSLNNRAADLTALLDSMSQGIQTIKAASEAIESGTKFLEQAKAVANQALETAQPVIARVSSEAELLAAIASDQKGLIVIEGKITLSDNTSLYLKDGQSLVGATYINGKPGVKSELVFNHNGGIARSSIIAASNSVISNLRISTSTDAFSRDKGMIEISGVCNVTLNNLEMDFNGTAYSGNVLGSAIRITDSDNTVISGKVSIKTYGQYARGIWTESSTIKFSDTYFQTSVSDIDSYLLSFTKSKIDITGASYLQLTSNAEGAIPIRLVESDFTVSDRSRIDISSEKSIAIFASTDYNLVIKDRAKLNIITDSASAIVGSYGIQPCTGVLNVLGNAAVNIKTSGNSVYGLFNIHTNIGDRAIVNIQTLGTNAFGVYGDSINLSGAAILNIKTAQSFAFAGNTSRGKLAVNLLSSAAKIYTSSPNTFNDQVSVSATTGSVISTSEGEYHCKDSMALPETAAQGNIPPSGFERTGDSNPPEQPDIDNLINGKPQTPGASVPMIDNRYQSILQQYDQLISDASYKGINLLTGQNLKINFNEDRSSKIDVIGVKADSGNLGLETKEWNGSQDIEQSISELEAAINTLRGYASQYGNYYSIVTTRQDFTENLINVLEEGADKLTLADMNQESANMLALQTSQQLAVNSLSLASQAAQSILRLF